MRQAYVLVELEFFCMQVLLCVHPSPSKLAIEHSLLTDRTFEICVYWNRVGLPSVQQQFWLERNVSISLWRLWLPKN